MSNVNIHNLHVRYGENEILKGVDLNVAECEFLVLLGPSGCGKSTLLHTIAGLIDVTEGTIEIGGEDMTWVDPSARNIGMVFQSYALYPNMNVERNMSFGLRVKGMPAPEIKRRVQRAAEILHLQPLLGRKPAQLSGGQRQRVAIGRALVREAGVLLLDEPLSNLDAKLRTELRRELKLLHKSLRSTMIYVTHDQVEAMTLATRIVVMRDGVIQQIGTPSDVYEKPDNLFVAGFLGAPGMNFWDGLLTSDGPSISFISSGLKLEVSNYAFQTTPSAETSVVLGIRPEQVRIENHGKLSGVICMVEPMGNHQVVWIECSGNMLCSVVHDPIEFKVDESIRFTIDSTRISLFEKSGEQRL